MVKAHTIDQDALIGAYVHLQGYPMEQFALDTLRRVGSLVKPIMRKHGWRISKLAEFYPEPSLWGLNTSYPGTSRLPTIQLRLRQPYDSKVFLPYEAVVDTMVHELTHCRFGPHDDKFWNMYRELKKEVETLIFSGYTGEGFLSKGRTLGATPKGLNERETLIRAREEAARRRKAREAQGRTLGREPGRRLGEPSKPSGSGRTLSGPASSSRPPAGGRTVTAPNPPSEYATPGQLAAEAAIRRNKDKPKSIKGGHKLGGSSKPPPPRNYEVPHGPGPNQGCHGVREAPPSEVDQEIALMNGFTTVAEMEDANERAILQAAIELLMEAELEEETMSNTIANGLLTEEPLPPSPKPQSAPQTPQSGSGSRTSPIHVESAAIRNDETITRRSGQWACKTCTFINEGSHLQCICGDTHPDLDGDGSKAPIKRQQTYTGASASGNASSSDNNTNKGKRKALESLARIPKPEESYWICHRCDTVVSHEWWTCTNCACMKLSG